MLKNTTRDLFYVHGIYPSDSAIESCWNLTQPEIAKVISMCNEAQRYRAISSRELLTKLAESLLNDLATIHCCAISGEPASPCYIGRHVGMPELGFYNKNLYMSCSIA